MDTVKLIVSLLEERGISNTTFLHDLKLNKSALGEWKNGKTTSYTKHIDKIADYLDVSVDYLLGRTNAQTLTELHVPDNLKEVPMTFNSIKDLTQNDLDEISKFVDYIKNRKK